MASGARRALSAALLLVFGMIGATVLPAPDGLALPSYGPEVSSVVIGSTEPPGLIVIADDPSPDRGVSTELTQRRVGNEERLSGSDEELLHRIDVAFGHDRTPRRPDGSVDMPAVLDEVAPPGLDVRAIAPATWVVDWDVDPSTIERLPGVAAVERDFLVAPVAEDPLLDEQWGLLNRGQTVEQVPGIATVDVGWQAARTSADGTDVVVAVVDSGIDLSHPDLAGSVWLNPGELCGNGLDDDGNGFVDDCNGYDFINRDGNPFDRVTAGGAPVDNNHGTHVAGIIAATADNGVGGAGVAPGVRIMSVKVFENGATSISRIIEAIDYASSNGATIINLSLGSAPGSPYSQALSDAVTRAGERGALVVVAAGNDGVNIDQYPVWPASLSNSNLVTVGASTNRDDRAGFSNFGSIGVDLFAPGWGIVSTVPGGYARYHGTSMATPMVAGVAALASERLGTTDPLVVKAAVFSGAVAAPAFTDRSVTGGRVSAAGTLGYAVLAPGSVTFTADGLEQFLSGGVDAVLTAGSPSADELGVDLEVTLATMIGGRAHAVIGYPLTVAVGGEQRTAATSETGAVAIRLSGGHRVELARGTLDIQVTADLPDGAYLVYLSGATASGTALAGSAAGFGVGSPPQDPQTDPAPDTDSESTDETGPPTGGVIDPGPPPAGEPTDGRGTESVPIPAPSADGGVIGGDVTGDVVDGGGSSSTGVPPTNETAADADQTSGANDAGIGETGGAGSLGIPDGSSTVSGPAGDGGGLESPSSGEPDGLETGPGAGAVVSPSEGPTPGGTLVRIDGVYRGVGFVLFGTTASPFVVVGTDYLLAETPPHEAGVVDVVVIHAGGRTTYSGAFTFVAGSAPRGDDPAPGRGGSTSSGTVSDGSPSDGVAAPTPIDEPAPTTPLPPPSSPSEPVDAPTSTTTATAPPPVPSPSGSSVMGETPTVLANGLTVDVFGSAHALGSSPVVVSCSAGDCRATIVGGS